MALLARDGAIPPLCAQLLIYPATDLAGDVSRLPTDHRGAFRSRRTRRAGSSATTSGAGATRSIGAHRPCARTDLGGTAPALVLTASYDPLCDEGEAYARRLEREGVRVTYIHFADQIHGFLTMGRIIRASGTAIRMMAASLRDAFSR